MADKAKHSGRAPMAAGEQVSKKRKSKARKRHRAKRNLRKVCKHFRKGFRRAFFKAAKRAGEAFCLALFWAIGLVLYWTALMLGVPADLIADMVHLPE